MKKYFYSARIVKMIFMVTFMLLVGLQTPAMASDFGSKEIFMCIFGAALIIPLPFMFILGRRKDKNNEDDDYEDYDDEYDDDDDDNDDEYVSHARKKQQKALPVRGNAGLQFPVAAPSRCAALVGVYGYYSGQEIRLSSTPITLGRDSLKCQIMFPESSCAISRVHCVIDANNDRYMICDLSSNGTWVNGQKMSRGASVMLANGSEISLANGAEVFRFTC
ncbi:MAG: FHA domain-containing protein [Synergistes sp.]|nr:FHA domain-containing protein [Synergistes sp.]